MKRPSYLFGSVLSLAAAAAMAAACGDAGEGEEAAPPPPWEPPAVAETDALAEVEGIFDGEVLHLTVRSRDALGRAMVRSMVLPSVDAGTYGSTSDGTTPDTIAIEQVPDTRSTRTNGVSSGAAWDTSRCGGIPTTGTCAKLILRDLFSTKVLTHAFFEITTLTPTGSTTSVFVPAPNTANDVHAADTFYGVSAAGRYRWGSEGTGSPLNDGPDIAFLVHGATPAGQSFSYYFKGALRADHIAAPARADVVSGTSDVLGTYGAATAGNGPASGRVSLSSDGRYMAFTSASTNLVAGTDTGYKRVYRADLETGTVELVSVSDTVTDPENCDSKNPSISDDGQVVAFESDCQLDPLDTNSYDDVYVRRLSGTPGTIFASRTRTGTAPSYPANPNRGARNASISPNGAYVAFESDATNLVLYRPGGRTFRDIYRRDVSSLAAPSTSIIPVTKITSGGTEWVNADSYYPSIGIASTVTVVAFESAATNAIASGDTNGVTDVFVFTHSTSGSFPSSRARVSTAADGSQLTGASGGGAVAPDGEWVAFHNAGTVIAAAGSNGNAQVYTRARSSASSVALVSRTPAGTIGNGPSTYGVMGGTNARFVAFRSEATDLVASASVSGAQVYVLDRSASKAPFLRAFLSSGDRTFSPVSQTVTDYAPAFSRDARFVGFTSPGAVVAGSSGTHAFWVPAGDVRGQ
ncbi:MAG: hypothetical protein IT376_21995 [Polyangiaceae bacterium]|nr:hypothetical protein [Polyangiaceae bacterium]